MSEKLQTLPIGIQSFEMLCRDGLLYVDKTHRLQKIISSGRRYFLSRPRRFGKSLTLSTLDAMFQGKAELFQGLAAEAWVAEQARHPAPVLRLDMSTMDVRDVPDFETSLMRELERKAEDAGLPIKSSRPGDAFRDLLIGLYNRGGPVAVLIDEYDKPILDKIGDLKAAEAMREVLRGFYTVLKGSDEYLRFVMLTGISKFTKTGVFSAMNNLRDISMSDQYGDIVGYTQKELEENFPGWIGAVAERMKLSHEELLARLKDYYDGFCFDGVTRLYNPFSILNFLADGKFLNYWYGSGSPSFIVTYMQQHGIKDPEAYRHLKVTSDFVGSQEIERARPESFLYQAGYLTIESLEEEELTLDYPNREVMNSISRIYLDIVYDVKNYGSLGSQLWRSLKEGDVGEAVRLYNTALSCIPYEDFTRQNESLYRSLFLMLLRGAGITANGEVHTHRGRSDVLVRFPERAVVLEFKLARGAGEVERLRAEGQRQIEEKGYAQPFAADDRACMTGVIVVDTERREAVL